MQPCRARQVPSHPQQACQPLPLRPLLQLDQGISQLLLAHLQLMDAGRDALLHVAEATTGAGREHRGALLAQVGIRQKDPSRGRGARQGTAHAARKRREARPKPRGPLLLGTFPLRHAALTTPPRRPCPRSLSVRGRGRESHVVVFYFLLCRSDYKKLANIPLRTS